MSNLALKKVEFKIPEWNYFVSEMQSIFHLSDSETENLSKSSTAKIIAAIPFIAGCYRPHITAISHLSLYLTELRGVQKYCACSPLDDIDIYERLEPISHFRGGDQKIIKYGMDTLAYIMIEGYHKSKNIDTENGNYNPFVSGSWNYRIVKKQLLKNVFVDFNPFISFISEDLVNWN